MISGSLIVESGATLTIEPGVVVKFDQAAQLRVAGDLTARGSADMTITFTSLRDDTLAGDTNGDGDASTPAPGDWDAIQVERGASATLDHVLVRYGGSGHHGGLFGHSEGTTLSISNSRIAGNDFAGISISDGASVMLDGGSVIENYGHGVEAEDATVVVVRSEISRNSVYGIQIQGEAGQLTVEDSTVSENQEGGIAAGAPALLSDNTISGNLGHAVTVSPVDGQPSFNITNNTIQENDGYWVYVDYRGGSGLPMLSGNTHSDNGLDHGIGLGGYLGLDMKLAPEPFPDLTYVVDFLGIEAAATLTLEPGVVLKFDSHGVLALDGQLIARGTRDDPITFTSLEDDSLVGDTNGDGDATVPWRGSWAAIHLYWGAKATIEHAAIRYGGEFCGDLPWCGAIIARDGTAVDITKSLIEHTAAPGIYGENASIIVRESTLSDIGASGILTTSSQADLTVQNSEIRDSFGSGIEAAGPSTISGNVVRNSKYHGVELRPTEDVSRSTIRGNTFVDNGRYGLFVRYAGGYALPLVSENELSGNEIDEAIVLGGRIGQDTLIPYHPGLQFAIAYLRVDEAALLTIEPRVVLKFIRGSHLTIDGKLIARGTAEDEVYFTSLADDSVGSDINGDGDASAPAPGDWRCIELLDGAEASFEHTVIRFGGASCEGSLRSEPDAGALTLVNSEISWSISNGVFVEDGDLHVGGSQLIENAGDGISFLLKEDISASSITDTLFRDNDRYAAFIDYQGGFGTPTFLDNTISGNGLGNALAVRGEIGLNTTFANLSGSAYLVPKDDSLLVPESLSLTLEAGVVMKFADASSINIYGGLIAAGEADKEVIFTSFRDDSVGGDVNADWDGSVPEPGDWQALRFEGDSSGALTYTQVRYAGGSGSTPASVVLWPECEGEGCGPELTLNHASIRDSYSSGIHAEMGSSLHIAESTFAHNGLDGVRAIGAKLAMHNSESHGNAFHGLTHSSSWLEAPALLEGNTFAENAYDGVAVSNVTKMSNNLVRDNARDGIVVSLDYSDLVPTISDNLIENNQRDGIFVSFQGGAILPTLSGNILRGNGLDNGIGLGGTIGALRVVTMTMEPDHFPDRDYVIQDLRVSSTSTLILRPGVVLKVDIGAGLYVEGEVRSLGSEADPVWITSLRDDSVGEDADGDGAAHKPEPGDWDTFRLAGPFEIRHTNIRYAGGNKQCSLQARDAQQGLLHTVEISDGGWNGACVSNIPKVEILGSVINGHLRSGLSLDSGHVLVRNSQITNNQSVGVHASGPSSLEIRENTIANNAGGGVLAQKHLIAADNSILENGGDALTIIHRANSDGEPAITDNQILRNAGHSISVQYINGSGLPHTSGNVISGNDLDAGLVLSGTIGEDMVFPRITDPDLTYVVEGLGVNLRTLTTIEPGVVIKMVEGYGLAVSGELQAAGSAEEPIIITSLKDDRWRGDTNGDGASTQPSPGDWAGFRIARNASADLDHVQIFYGGRENAVATLTVDRSAALRLEHTSIRHSQAAGIRALDRATLDIRESLIGSSGGPGMVLHRASIIMEASSITNNGTAGLEAEDSDVTVTKSLISGNGTFGILNHSEADVVQAIDNWWGDPTGPYHPTTNPTGRGDAVSDFVAYAPWLTTSSEREPVPLPLDTIVQETVPTFGYDDYFLEAEGGRSLLVEITPLDGSDNLWVYSRFAAMAQWNHYSEVIKEPNVRDTYALLVSPTRDGRYFFSVFGQEVSVLGGSYQIQASYIEAYLSDVSPTSASATGAITLRLSGMPFVPGMRLELRQAGRPPLSALETVNSSPRLLLTKFDLSGAPIGEYDLLAFWPNGDQATLQGAFQVIPGSGPSFEANLQMPHFHRRNRMYSAWVEYANEGTGEMPAPLLIISSSPSTAMKAPCDSGWSTNAVQLLAVGENAPAGVLPPQSRPLLPLFFMGTRDDLSLQLDVMAASDDPIHWMEYKDAMRPNWISPDEWDELWPHLESRLGDTWSDYLGTLGENAERLRLRRQDNFCVSELVELAVLETRGDPTAAITGQVANSETMLPLLGATVVAYSQDGEAIRRAETNLVDGWFVIEGLPEGQYELAVEGYYFDPPTIVDVQEDQDLIDLQLTALPISEPEEPPSEPTLITSDLEPTLVADENGELHLIWQRGEEIWHARFGGDDFSDYAPIPGATGTDPAATPSVPSGQDPEGSLLVVWSSGFGNEAHLEHTLGRPDEEGSWTWSETSPLTDDPNGDTEPAIIFDPSGQAILLWLQQDWDGEDDSDLYYLAFEPLWSPALETQNRQYPFDEASPQPPTLASSPCREIPLKQERTIPRWVPILGGDYGFSLNGNVCGKGICALTMEGKLSADVKFTDYLSGSGSAGVEASWQTDPYKCCYIFHGATVNWGASAEGEIPIYAPGKVLPGVTAELGAHLSGSSQGTIEWEGANFPDRPSGGEIELEVGAGPYGELVFFRTVTAKITGTGSVSGIYTPPKEFEFTGWCMAVEASAKAFILKYKWSKKWGPCTQTTMTTLQEMHRLGDIEGAALASATEEIDQVPVTELLLVTVEPQIGSGAVYEGFPVLADTIETDLFRDGPPDLVQSGNGEIWVAWTKDSQNPGLTVGSSILVANFDGDAWSPPQQVQSSAFFNKNPAFVFDSSDVPMIAWSSAPADATLDSSAEDVLAALAGSEIFFARRLAGSWSTPEAILPLAGQDEGVRLAADNGGRVFAAWIHTEGESQSIASAQWSEGAWDALPSIELDGSFGSLDLAIHAGSPVLVWSEEVPFDSRADKSFSLRYSIWKGNAWSSPRAIERGEATFAQTAGTSEEYQPSIVSPTYASFPGSPPSECCKVKKPIPPPPPPDDLLTRADQGVSEGIRSVDPNEKIGMRGVGPHQLVSPSENLHYSIYFENMPSASAPAQEVFIIDELASNLDWKTFRVQEIAFADQIISGSGGPGSFYA